jgi:hypothetical protein
MCESTVQGVDTNELYSIAWVLVGKRDSDFVLPVVFFGRIKA